MSAHSSPEMNDAAAEAEYFLWLETQIRDVEALRMQQMEIQADNPVLYRVIADTAAELSGGDAKAHATYFGTFLLMVAEREIRSIEVV